MTISAVIIIGSKQKLARKSVLNVSIAAQNMQQVVKVKLSDLVIDSSLSWTEHINMFVNKMDRSVAITIQCCQYVKRDTLQIITKSLTLCH